MRMNKYLLDSLDMHTLALKSINMPKSMLLEPVISFGRREKCHKWSGLPLISLDTQSHGASRRHDLIKNNHLGTRFKRRNQSSQDTLDMSIRPVVQDPAEHIPGPSKVRSVHKDWEMII